LPSDHFDRDGDTKSHVAPVIALFPTRRAERLRRARRELRWFYGPMRGRVPALGDASRARLVAASQIALWLSTLDAGERGVLLLCFDGRRWPARLTRWFGEATGLAVRRATMLAWHPGETEAVVEATVVKGLLQELARGRLHPADCEVRRGAEQDVRFAVSSYAKARGDARCVAPAEDA
jgi:hypothetical protein